MNMISAASAQDVTRTGDTPNELPRRFAKLTRDVVKDAEKVTRSKGKVVAIRTADAIVFDESDAEMSSLYLRKVAARLGATLPRCPEPGCVGNHIGDGLGDDEFHHLGTGPATQTRDELGRTGSISAHYLWSSTGGGTAYIDDGAHMRNLTVDAVETLMSELQKVLDVARLHPQMADGELYPAAALA